MAKTPEQKVAEAAEKFARAKALARKADTRRKVLMGTFMQTHFSEDQIKEMMGEYLKRDADRRLFGLEPLSKQDPKPTPTPNIDINKIDPFDSI